MPETFQAGPRGDELAGLMISSLFRPLDLLLLLLLLLLLNLLVDRVFFVTYSV